jgi:hypothetical protein
MTDRKETKQSRHSLQMRLDLPAQKVGHVVPFRNKPTCTTQSSDEKAAVRKVLAHAEKLGRKD